MPVPASIRLVVAAVVGNDVSVDHFDAEQAFVQSKLDPNVYVKISPGCGNLSGKTF